VASSTTSVGSRAPPERAARERDCGRSILAPDY
jgi:hypothetical protein